MSIGPLRPGAARSSRVDEPARRAPRQDTPPEAERRAFERAYARAADDSMTRGDDGAGKAPPSGDAPVTAEMALRWSLLQQRALEPPTAPAPARGGDRELIELLIRQVSAVLRPVGGGPGRIALRLDPRAYGDTDLWIEQSADGGWLLQARSADERMAAALASMSDVLVQRFAAAGLGALEVRCDSASGATGVAPR